MMTGRLILAIVSTLVEEAAIVAVVLWGLPQAGIHLPLPGLIAIMVAWGALSVFTYRKGSQALRRKPITGLPAMVGSRGKAVSSLTQGGYVRIKGELWEAEAADDEIDRGEKITVIGQDGLKLIVRKGIPDDLEKAK